jgi:hypothetical protein
MEVKKKIIEYAVHEPYKIMYEGESRERKVGRDINERMDS